MSQPPPSRPPRRDPLPENLLKSARASLSRRYFHACRLAAEQLDPQFPGAAQILAIAYTLIAVKSSNNPYLILQLPDNTRNLSQIADQFKKLMNLVTDPKHSFPFADEAQQHLQRAYSLLSNPNYAESTSLDQELILKNGDGQIKNPDDNVDDQGLIPKDGDCLIKNPDDGVDDQELTLKNGDGLIKNLDDDVDDQEPVLTDGDGLIKNLDDDSDDQELTHDFLNIHTAEDDDHRIKASLGSVDQEQKVLLMCMSCLPKPNQEGVHLCEGCKRDFGSYAADDQKDRIARPKKRKY